MGSLIRSIIITLQPQVNIIGQNVYLSVVIRPQAFSRCIPRHVLWMIHMIFIVADSPTILLSSRKWRSLANRLAHWSFQSGTSSGHLRRQLVFWNYDYQTVFHTAELSTNSRGILRCLGIQISTDFPHSGAFNTFPEGMCGVLKLWFPNNLPQDGDCNKFLWGLCSVLEFAVACSWTLDSGVGAAQGQASICGGLLLNARLRSWSRSGSGVHLRWFALGR